MRQSRVLALYAPDMAASASYRCPQLQLQLQLQDAAAVTAATAAAALCSRLGQLLLQLSLERQDGSAQNKGAMVIKTMAPDMRCQWAAAYTHHQRCVT